MENTQDEHGETRPGGQGTIILTRRTLLMLGLGTGAIGLVGALVSSQLAATGPQALPAGYAYVTFQGNFLTFENRYVVMELSSW